MSSVFPPLTPTEVALSSLRDELKGNIFRNLDGLFTKYFEGKPWSSVIQEKLREVESAKILNRLSDDIHGIAHFDTLLEWLANFQTFQLLSTTGSTAQACIYLETSDLQSTAGSTRVFGEFHHESAPAETDDDIMRFCWRAQQVFKFQSARCFVHGFLVRGTTLELWVFDRSGAYSSDKFDLARRPDLLLRTLAGYTVMSDEAVGFNTFVKRLAPRSDSFVTFDQDEKFHLRPELIATANYIVGPGTSCYVASTTSTGEPSTVIKFSWREDDEPTEIRLLQRAHERNAWGVIQLSGYQDLMSIADIRQGLQFPETCVNKRFSCVATTPLGRPIRQFTSVRELLEVLCDLVRALQSLYVKARILHRDVAMKNLIITHQHSVGSPKGVLIDLNCSLDLDNVCPVEPIVGSDGVMAIGVLYGQRHTYRHDLESLFYVFLWIVIANDREHDEANDILKGMPKTSRLWKWCSMNFLAVGKDKAADMSPEGFEGILDEFSSDFTPLKGLAKELHALIFPVRDGKIFIGTEKNEVAVQRLYDEIADAFTRSALAT